jgi:hypothetical protein
MTVTTYNPAPHKQKGEPKRSTKSPVSGVVSLLPHILNPRGETASLLEKNFDFFLSRSITHKGVYTLTEKFPLIIQLGTGASKHPRRRTLRTRAKGAQNIYLKTGLRECTRLISDILRCLDRLFYVERIDEVCIPVSPQAPFRLQRPPLQASPQLEGRTFKPFPAPVEKRASVASRWDWRSVSYASLPSVWAS